MPPSLISPLVTGTEPVDPSTYVTFFRPWTQALECTRRGHGLLAARAPRGWPPGAGRTVARPRNCGSWWAATRLQRPATRLQRPATRLDVSCRYAAQVSGTGSKLFYGESGLFEILRMNQGHPQSRHTPHGGSETQQGRPWPRRGARPAQNAGVHLRRRLTAPPCPRPPLPLAGRVGPGPARVEQLETPAAGTVRTRSCVAPEQKLISK